MGSQGGQVPKQVSHHTRTVSDSVATSSSGQVSDPVIKPNYDRSFMYGVGSGASTANHEQTPQALMGESGADADIQGTQPSARASRQRTYPGKEMDQGVEVDMQFESEPSWYNAGDQQVPGRNYYGVEGEEMDSYGGPSGKGPKLNYINRPYLDNSRGHPGFT